jgi:hypothetical protein
MSKTENMPSSLKIARYSMLAGITAILICLSLLAFLVCVKVFFPIGIYGVLGMVTGAVYGLAFQIFQLLAGFRRFISKCDWVYCL